MEELQNESNCERTICNNTDLLTEEGFMTKDSIDEKCRCDKENRCKQIIDLLKQKQRKRAEDLLLNQ